MKLPFGIGGGKNDKKGLGKLGDDIEPRHTGSLAEHASDAGFGDLLHKPPGPEAPLRPARGGNSTDKDLADMVNPPEGLLTDVPPAKKTPVRPEILGRTPSGRKTRVPVRPSIKEAASAPADFASGAVGRRQPENLHDSLQPLTNGNFRNIGISKAADGRKFSINIFLNLDTADNVAERTAQAEALFAEWFASETGEPMAGTAAHAYVEKEGKNHSNPQLQITIDPDQDPAAERLTKLNASPGYYMMEKTKQVLNRLVNAGEITRLYSEHIQEEFFPRSASVAGPSR